jgi:uncharacterized phiE125 gp8 family phage protein
VSLSQVLAPATEPVTLDEAKKHLRVDVPDEDALIDDLIRGAREYAETFTHRSFLTQTWDDKREAFPCDGEAIWLPQPPLLSVTSVTYVDTAGVTQTWSPTLYTVDAPVGPKARAGCLVPNYGEIYPSTRDVVNAVTIRFVAGYGAASAVPRLILACLKEHVRASWVRGDAAESQRILAWVHTQLWAYKAW